MNAATDNVGTQADSDAQPFVHSSRETLSISLVQACSEGDIRQIEALLRAGADPNYQCATTVYGIPTTTSPILAAADVAKRTDSMPKMLLRQSGRILRLLISAGAVAAPKEKQILETLAATGNEEGFELIATQQGVRPARYAHALVSSAMMHHHPNFIATLRRYGIDPNVRDAWGATPLLDICSAQLPFFHDTYWTDTREKEFWYLRHLTALAAVGVDLNVRDRVGATPLMRAIVSKQLSIARALVHAGADIECHLKNGVATLHLAAYCTNREFMEMLMSHLPSRRDLIRMKLLRLQPDVRAFMLTRVRVADSGPRENILTDVQRKKT
jgi:ankyrin repeat protein